MKWNAMSKPCEWLHVLPTVKCTTEWGNAVGVWSMFDRWISIRFLLIFHTDSICFFFSFYFYFDSSFNFKLIKKSLFSINKIFYFCSILPNQSIYNRLWNAVELYVIDMSNCVPTLALNCKGASMSNVYWGS